MLTITHWCFVTYFYIIYYHYTSPNSTMYNNHITYLGFIMYFLFGSNDSPIHILTVANQVFTNKAPSASNLFPIVISTPTPCNTRHIQTLDLFIFTSRCALWDVFANGRFPCFPGFYLTFCRCCNMEYFTLLYFTPSTIFHEDSVHSS